VRVKGKKLPVGIYELRGIGAPSPADAAVIADFEAGIAAYRARNWDEAEARFKKVRRPGRTSGPARTTSRTSWTSGEHPPARAGTGCTR
jgi:adenylate cyclase